MPSRIEFPFGLGARYKDDERDFGYSAAPRVFADMLPVRVDNRALFAGIPVWNQGKEGACVGMALGAALSKIHGVVLSPRDMFDRAKHYDEWPGENYDGSSGRGGLDAAKHEGCCLWDLYPFRPFDTSGKSPLADADAALHKITRYERLDGSVQMRHAIAIEQHGFCVATLDVHTGWIKPTKDHRIRYDARYIRRGLHFVLLCGYDDEDYYWLVRNSWSAGWADGGYGWLSYKDAEANLYDAWLPIYEAA
jgi:hypothetical protein